MKKLHCDRHLFSPFVKNTVNLQKGGTYKNKNGNSLPYHEAIEYAGIIVCGCRYQDAVLMSESTLLVLQHGHLYQIVCLAGG